MKIKFSLKKVSYSGETIGTKCTIYLWNCFSWNDVLECINHEALHAVLNHTAQTRAKEDHWIMKNLWFRHFFLCILYKNPINVRLLRICHYNANHYGNIRRLGSICI